MNIGFSTFVLQGGRSGLSTYILDLLGALQCEDAQNTYSILMAENEAQLLPLSNPNFTRISKPAWINRPLPNLLWHNTALAWGSSRFDLLHIPSARRIPLLKRTKVVATVHDLAAFHIAGKYDRARMFFNRRAVPAMIRRADRIIAVSEQTRNDLVRYAGYDENRISVIYSGIDHDLFAPVAKAEARERLRLLHGMEKPFFVYVSRLEHPAKNHLRLIEAFERFKLENDSMHQLVFAGADWSGAAVIRERAAISPVKEDILFLGFVQKSSLPLLYSGCDLMVFPSLFEGFGLPIIEALACGAPVICSNTSAMKELAGEWIPTFDPADSGAIFECIAAAVSAGRTEGDRVRGMECAQHFNWRETARKVMEVYRSVG